MIMASDRPASAKERKARMEAVAARLEAEEKERLQEHRRACHLPEPSAAGDSGGDMQEVPAAQRMRLQQMTQRCWSSRPR